MALLAGQCIFAGAVLFLRQKKDQQSITDQSVFLIVAVALAAIGFFVGNLLYKQMVAKALTKETFTEKIATYQSGMIIRCASAEGPALFNIVCFFLTGNYIFMGILAVLLAYFLSIRPTLDGIADALQLTYEEKAELERG
ncbi:hypothetical protein [Mucilaginibacter conchicola]|nr:hypothetical protein [Mucilaginibacter conchicola]